MQTFKNIRPSVMDVDLDRLRDNYSEISSHVSGADVMPILKANAYGHGLVACARELEKLSPWGFGVAFLEEGIELRNAGIRSAILALGGVSGRQIDGFLDYDIDFCASSIAKLEAIEERAKQRNAKARIHIKIDTGMERIGVHYYNSDKLFEAALKCSSCEIVGVFSHLADAENEDQTFTKLQIERFEEAVSFFEKRSEPRPKLHIANSPALLSIPESHFDIVRPGLSLYGVSPAPHLSSLLNLSPVMKLSSEVCYFKVIPKDAHVSYGLTWKSQEQTRVVTVPMGYGDGYPRFLSNKGRVLIRGKSYPIVGRVCMDQFMVNIGPDGEAYNGDEVVLIGEQGDAQVRVEELCAVSDIDPRDLMLRIASRVPRRYRRGGEIFVA